ncbi:sperm acrosome developmental regulator [Nycticebus coucang]|uniref:sperm acrosome developmental regulator n=1 Tax=Nycticebus coucang TaxID=9470 RepID=UPI00234C7A52|nr:sperm acrosome developmental regulator [Nycticebus coucang]
MAVVMRFFRWVRRAWQKITCWVFFWRKKVRPTILEHSGSKKHAMKGVEKTPKVVETFTFVQLPKEDKLPNVDASPELAEPCVLAKTRDRTKMELGSEGRSLLRLPQTAVQSVSTLMVSALQTGWQMCSWKSSVSSASITSQMMTQSPLQTPEAELLREVYLVLWAIRKQLRQLSRRQERRKRRHTRTHTSPQPELVQCLKQDARSPL